MNRQLSPAELATLAIPTMTKRDKLLRLAQIVRAVPHRTFMFSNVEHMTIVEKRTASHPNSAFSLAASDPIFKDAGLQGSSVLEGERFFELTREELHTFACDCGGQLDNHEMARRIEFMAHAG